MPPVELTRRDFLKLSAAAAALAGAGCTRPAEPIVPYASMPEHALPGVPQFFATAMPLGTDAEGLLVESSTGRPIKAEGNPRHPSSLGGTSVQGQAAILQLWDPDRSQAPRLRGQPAGFEQFGEVISDDRQKPPSLLVGTVTSPTLLAQLGELRKNGARVHSWDPLHRANSLEGARLAFGSRLLPIYDFEKAGAILSLDCDFLSDLPGRLRYARQFAKARKREAMSRLYALESTPTLAGARADHRYAMRLSEIEEWLLGSFQNKKIILEDLKKNRGLIVAGESLPPWAHALVHRLNRELGAPVSYVEPPEGPGFESLVSLVEDMKRGKTQALLMLGGNPVYDAPADLDFAGALANVPLSIHHSLYFDETSARATWHLPATHFLEHWSDVRAFDGTASVVQPLIAPLYGGISPHEMLSFFSAEGTANDYQRVRERWGANWEDSLRTGVIAGSAFKPVALPLKAFSPGTRKEPPALEIRFAPDPGMRDGAFANNAWLQELPNPHTKLTWDNAALVAPSTARELHVQTGDVVEIASHERKIEAPIWVLPGHAGKTITLPLGFGRDKAGRVGSGVGFNAFALRRNSWSEEATVRKVGTRHRFASTQNHSSMEGRDLSKIVFKNQRLPEEKPQPTLYPPWPYDSYRWAMAIDLDACIGCNACTIACQAENNIPTVGKEQVIAGREMHWIRVDRYHEGPEDKPTTLFQPVPCMHCEKAPCEEVCPVGATLHDSEGLNLQVYNRCVGTRFCSQNCPYKVRRFNFLEYSKNDESLKAQKNPEVTVRMRGVMEKCTYCVQRITRARIGADREDRKLRDGEVVTACQAACPAAAISFGDLNDPQSAVNAAKASPLHYTLLHELNTKPRTTYLARVANPNPDLKETG